MRSRIPPCVLSCLLALATPVLAQAASKVREAETAYRQVDFARTLELAKAALEEGHGDLRQAERLYFLLGIAHAALGNDTEATAAFTSMLAINPEARLEKTLSPKLRGPYSEALGFWQSTSERLGATAEADARLHRVDIEISDPTEMVRWLEVRSRTAGGEYSQSLHPVSMNHSFQFSLPPGQTSEWMIKLLDQHRNVLFSLGSPNKPITFVPREFDASPVHAQVSVPGGSSLKFVGGVLVALGAASAGTAIPFHLDREKKAKNWNSARCEAPTGLTRGEQCADLKSSLDQAEARAVVLYGIGGALIAGGFVTWLLAPDRAAHTEEGQRSALSCEAGFGSIHCRATF